jgi:hypothetical protein
LTNLLLFSPPCSVAPSSSATSPHPYATTTYCPSTSDQATLPARPRPSRVGVLFPTPNDRHQP